MLPDYIRQRSAAEEVLLLKAELLALVSVIVRIEHTGDVLGVYLLL